MRDYEEARADEAKAAHSYAMLRTCQAGMDGRLYERIWAKAANDDNKLIVLLGRPPPLALVQRLKASVIDLYACNHIIHTPSSNALLQHWRLIASVIDLYAFIHQTAMPYSASSATMFDRNSNKNV